MTEKE